MISIRVTDQWRSGMRNGAHLASRTVRRFVLLLGFPVMILLWIFGRPLYRAYLSRLPESYWKKVQLRVLNEMTLRRQIGVWADDFRQNPTGERTAHKTEEIR